MSEVGRYGGGCFARNQVVWEGYLPCRKEHSLGCWPDYAWRWGGNIERRGCCLISRWSSSQSIEERCELLKSAGLVTATLEAGGGCFHVMSCYAPTYAAQRKEKDEFFNLLQ